ncbi:MAG: hypothetical protein ACPG40_11225, partial [Alphaproteobacteria bacterium]
DVIKTLPPLVRCRSLHPDGDEGLRAAGCSFLRLRPLLAPRIGSGPKHKEGWQSASLSYY